MHPPPRASFRHSRGSSWAPRAPSRRLESAASPRSATPPPGSAGHRSPLGLATTAGASLPHGPHGGTLAHPRRHRPAINRSGCLPGDDMYIGLFLVIWIGLGVVLFTRARGGTATQEHGGDRRTHARPQVVVAASRSRGRPSTRARRGVYHGRAQARRLIRDRRLGRVHQLLFQVGQCILAAMGRGTRPASATTNSATQAALQVRMISPSAP
jgi:hypothetical protein